MKRCQNPGIARRGGGLTHAKISSISSSADAVPSGRPIWASHMDSVCTAPQCLNCVDTVVKSRPPWTPLDHDHCNHWIPLLATFDIPPLILMTLC